MQVYIQKKIFKKFQSSKIKNIITFLIQPAMQHIVSDVSYNVGLVWGVHAERGDDGVQDWQIAWKCLMKKNNDIFNSKKCQKKFYFLVLFTHVVMCNKYLNVGDLGCNFCRTVALSTGIAKTIPDWKITFIIKTWKKTVHNHIVYYLVLKIKWSCITTYINCNIHDESSVHVGLFGFTKDTVLWFYVLDWDSFTACLLV